MLSNGKVNDGPPPLLTWEETIRHPGMRVVFSGPAPSTSTTTFAWLTIMSGVLFLMPLLLFKDGFNIPKRLYALIPISIISLGIALRYKWRAGAPSAGTLEADATNLWVIGGASLPWCSIESYDMRLEEQTFTVQGGSSISSGADRWYRVFATVKDGTMTPLLCFGDEASASYAARRLGELMDGVRARSAV